MSYESALKRLQRATADIPQNKRELLMPLIKEAAFLEDKLAKAREIMKSDKQSFALFQDGWKMPHRNAEMDGYLSALQRYGSIMDTLCAQLPQDGTAVKDAEGKLNKFRNMGFRIA